MWGREKLDEWLADKYLDSKKEGIKDDIIWWHYTNKIENK